MENSFHVYRNAEEAFFHHFLESSSFFIFFPPSRLSQIAFHYNFSIFVYFPFPSLSLTRPARCLARLLVYTSDIILLILLFSAIVLTQANERANKRARRRQKMGFNFCSLLLLLLLLLPSPPLPLQRSAHTI
jgi:hypothetical protein